MAEMNKNSELAKYFAGITGKKVPVPAPSTSSAQTEEKATLAQRNRKDKRTVGPSKASPEVKKQKTDAQSSKRKEKSHTSSKTQKSRPSAQPTETLTARSKTPQLFETTNLPLCLDELIDGVSTSDRSKARALTPELRQQKLAHTVHQLRILSSAVIEDSRSVDVEKDRLRSERDTMEVSAREAEKTAARAEENAALAKAEAAKAKGDLAALSAKYKKLNTDRKSWRDEYLTSNDFEETMAAAKKQIMQEYYLSSQFKTDVFPHAANFFEFGANYVIEKFKEGQEVDLNEAIGILVANDGVPGRPIIPLGIGGGKGKGKAVIEEEDEGMKSSESAGEDEENEEGPETGGQANQGEEEERSPKP